MSELNVVQQKVKKLIKEVDRICTRRGISYSLGYGSVLGAVRHKGFIPWDSDIDILITLSEVNRFRDAMEKELPNDMRILMWDKTENYHPCFDRIVYKDISHFEIHIDVFPLCGLPDNIEEKKAFIKKCYKLYKILHCKHQDIKYSHKKSRGMIIFFKALLFFVPDSMIKNYYKKMQTRYDLTNANEVFSISSCYGAKDCTDKKLLTDTIRMPFEDLELPIPRDYDTYLTQLYGDYMTPRKY